MKRVATLLLIGMSACSPPTGAPSAADVCWRMFEVAGRQPRFEVLSRDVPNLESCAAQLEGARMMEGASTAGSYNGHFIFVTEQQITSARTLDGVQIRVFEADDRRRVQQGLRALIAERNGDRLTADSSGPP